MRYICKDQYFVSHLNVSYRYILQCPVSVTLFLHDKAASLAFE